MASQPAERTVEVEQDSASESNDDSQSTESDGDEEVTITPRPCPAQWTCPALVQQCPYHLPVHSHRSSTKHDRHHGRKRGKENHGERRHNTDHGHRRPNAHSHDHSDAQGDDSTECNQHDSEGRHRQSEGHHHGSKGHRHGSKGHHREKGHHRHRDSHRSRQGSGVHGRRHGHRHSSCSSEDGSALIFTCVDVQGFKQEEIKVIVSNDTVKVKAESDGGELSQVFKVGKDYDISKMRVSRSRSGVLTVSVPAKDSDENVKQDTNKK